MSVVHGEGFEVRLPDGWERIDPSAARPDDRDSRPGDPFTVANPSSGTGALQISTALNATEERPALGDLRDIVAALAKSNGLGAPIDSSYFQLEALRAAVSTYHHGDDFIRVWSVTDGTSFALATYVCRWGSEAAENEACDEIVRSLQFT